MSHKIIRASLPLAVALVLNSCAAALTSYRNSQETQEQPWLAALAIGSEGQAPAANTGMTSKPQLVVPESISFPSDGLQLQQSPSSVPATVQGTFVPVGFVYKAGPEGSMFDYPYRLKFPDGEVELHYQYDPAQVRSAGFTGEFGVFRYDDTDQVWEQIEHVSVDREKGEVVAYTDTLSSVLLAAVPPSTGTLADPPKCIGRDFPDGLGGSGHAVFTVVDGGFRYMRDRNYTIIQDSNFQDLGFSQGLAIATCNGDSPCGDASEHKLYTGTDYLSFQAQTNIDVYLMYDTRGGADINDDSQDAPWIASAGFKNTRRFIRTSDPAGRFRVYRKSYLRGETVRLDGNRRGVTASGIQSNYWIVIKRQGVNLAEPASRLCEASPVVSIPLAVTNAHGIPGATTATLLWQNPDDARFSRVMIRRSRIAPPSLPTDGVIPVGSMLHSQGFKDEGLTNNTDYYYTIFSLDQDDNVQGSASIEIRTGGDTDGDGIADRFERSETYPTGQPSDWQKADTDGDGISDGDEVAAGTDPTNPDTVAPDLGITLSSSTPASDPIIRFALAGSDNVGITGWMVTYTPTRPLSFASGWQSTAPGRVAVSSSGNYKIYAWAKDAAGNVSALGSPAKVTIGGINMPRFVYVTSSTANTLAGYEIDIKSAALTALGTYQVPDEPTGIVADPRGKYLYISSGSSGVVSQYGIDASAGGLSYVGQTPGVVVPAGLAINPQGSMVAVLNAKPDFGHPDDCTGPYNECGLGCLFFSPTPECAALCVAGLNQCKANPPMYGHIYAAEAFSVNGNGALSAMASVTASAKPSAGRFDPSGRYLYVSNFSPGNIGVLQASSGLSLVNTAPGGGTGLAIPPDNRHLYSAGNNTVQGFAITANSGALNSIGNWSVPGAVDVVTSPDGQMIYAISQSTSRLYAFRRDVSSGALTQLVSVPSGTGPNHIVIDDQGSWIFASDGSGNTVSVFELDRMSGLPVNRVSANGPDSPNGVAIYSQHDGNDPPFANAGSEHWVQIGTTAALSGAASVDPDGTRCGANQAAYIYRWTIVYAPPGSQITTNSIGNANTLGSASFRPDIPGDYIVRLSFTDDPGTCQGTSKTATATVLIHVGYYHSHDEDYLDKIGSPFVAGATWSETRKIPEDWGLTNGWVLYRRDSLLLEEICKEVVGYAEGLCESGCVAALVFAPVCEAGCYVAGLYGDAACKAAYTNKYDWYPYCMSVPASRSDLGAAFCAVVNPNDVVPNQLAWTRILIARAFFFIPTERHWHHIGFWYWWTYTP